MKSFLTFIMLLTFCCNNIFAQVQITNEVYTDVDTEAEFPGGMSGIHNFVIQNFSMPKMAMDSGISGVILIQFVVERDGTISDVKAVAPESRKLKHGLEEECIRVIKLTSGKWTPAKRLEKNVRSYWRFPFVIDNSVDSALNLDKKYDTLIKKPANITTIYMDDEVDSAAIFKSGTNGIHQLIIQNFKMPKAAQEMGISGNVLIQFVVEIDGTISDVKIVASKEKQLGYKIEEECIRVIKLTDGKWKPAIKDGIKVRSYWRFPFEIENSEGF